MGTPVLEWTPVIRLQIAAIGPLGEEDETAVAVLSDEGIIIDSLDLGTVGISWSDLKRILETPFAEECMDQARVETF